MRFLCHNNIYCKNHPHCIKLLDIKLLSAMSIKINDMSLNTHRNMELIYLCWNDELYLLLRINFKSSPSAER